MKITNQKIELAAAKDDARYYLTAPWVEGDEIVATDGTILAVLPANLTPDDVPGPVSSESIKAARKFGALRLTEKTADIPGGISYPRPDYGGTKMPEWRRLIPENIGKPDIVLDAESIVRLAKAICDVKGPQPKLLNLHFQRTATGALDGTSAVYVTPADKGGTGYGLISPARMPRKK